MPTELSSSAPNVEVALHIGKFSDEELMSVVDFKATYPVAMGRKSQWSACIQESSRSSAIQGGSVGALGGVALRELHVAAIPCCPMKSLKKFLPVALALSVTLAHAWGGDGHRLVAAAAAQQLTPRAQAEIERLLALEPGATLESISTWPDEHRLPGTATWHYVNFPRGSDDKFVQERDCQADACVVAAIAKQVAILRSSAPDAERLQALKYLVHFVGDVHQPLHAGYGDDRGGNSYQVQFNGRGTNLHSVWDSGLIKAWPGGIPALRATLLSQPAKVEDKTGPADWVEESIRIVETPGFYPSGHVLPEDYADKMDHVVLERLSLAGARLAATLNAAL